MDLTALTAFIGVVALALVIPGPDWVFLLAAGARGARVSSAVGGLMIGYVILSIAAAVGLGAVIATVPFALTVVAVVGAGYLVFLGVSILRAHPGSATAAVATDAHPGGGILIRGIGVSALNPKALLFFLAILPLFVRTESVLPATAQLGVYAGVYIAIATAFYLVLGTIAGRLSRTGRAGAVLNRVSGALMILVGIALLIEQALALTA